MRSNEYELRYYNEIIEREVSWLWYPYIPKGKITIVQGDPGDGKTMLMLYLIALITSGRSIPDGRRETEPANVIFQGVEDGLADTIKPRLLKAGADCSKVAYLEAPEEKELTLGDRRFADAIRKHNAKLLVIDPMQGFISSEMDIQRVGGIRSSLKKLSKVAEKTDCAIVLIGHMNKGGGSKGIYRGIGSIDVAAVARSILLVGRDQDDSDLRIMVPVKTSLAQEGKSQSFRITDKEGVCWLGKSGYTADDVLGNTVIGPKELKAKAALITMLTERDMASTDIYQRMSEMGISKRTVQKAKIRCNITTYRKDNAWHWRLEESEA